MPTRPCSSSATSRPAPSSTAYCEPEPPSNGVPSIVPSKSMTRKSPSWAPRSTAVSSATRRAQPLDLGVDGLLRHVGRLLHALEALVGLHLRRRLHLHLGRERERRALVGAVRPVDRRPVDGVDARHGDGPRVPPAQVVAQRLLDHGVAADLAHDERLRRLALAEPGHADRARQVGQRVVERVVDVARGHLDIEADAVVGEFGDLGLHTGETPWVMPPEPFSNLSRAGTGVPPARPVGQTTAASHLGGPRPQARRRAARAARSRGTRSSQAPAASEVTIASRTRTA